MCDVAGGNEMGKGACVVGGHAMARGCAWWEACMAGGGMHGQGGMCGRGACMPRTSPDTLRVYGRSMRGRCASYWNAILVRRHKNGDIDGTCK